MNITKEQQKSLATLYTRDADGAPSYLMFRRRVRPSLGTLMVHWCGMWVGIEPDGHRHT